MEVKHKKECDMAALYGQNGTGWMWSEGFPDLNQNTNVTIEGLSEADTKVICLDAKMDA